MKHKNLTGLGIGVGLGFATFAIFISEKGFDRVIRILNKVRS